MLVSSFTSRSFHACSNKGHVSFEKSNTAVILLEAPQDIEHVAEYEYNHGNRMGYSSPAGSPTSFFRRMFTLSERALFPIWHGQGRGPPAPYQQYEVTLDIAFNIHALKEICCFFHIKLWYPLSFFHKLWLDLILYNNWRWSS